MVVGSGCVTELGAAASQRPPRDAVCRRFYLLLTHVSTWRVSVCLCLCMHACTHVYPMCVRRWPGWYCEAGGREGPVQGPHTHTHGTAAKLGGETMMSCVSVRQSLSSVHSMVTAAAAVLRGHPAGVASSRVVGWVEVKWVGGWVGLLAAAAAVAMRLSEGGYARSGAGGMGRCVFREHSTAPAPPGGSSS